MLKRLLVLLALAPVVGISLGAQESIRLQFEIYRNGSLVGSPTVTGRDGTSASMSVDSGFDLTFTATRIAEDKVSVAFEIALDDKSIRPRVVLLNQEQGTISWKSASGSDSFEVRVSVTPGK